MVSKNWNIRGGNLFSNTPSNLSNITPTLSGTKSALSNTASNIQNKVQENPHFSLFILPVILYTLIAIYTNFVTKKTGLKEYIIFIYLSFFLLLLGYSRYCTSKLVPDSGMIFMISSYLMITSTIALFYFLYKVIIFKEDKTTTTTTKK
jgi:hypothetical protein